MATATPDIDITKQDIFNAAWDHFVVNNNPPSVMLHSHPVGKYCYKCCYLTDDGRKCAVGLCLPDGHKAQHSTTHFGVLIKCYPELFKTELQNLITYTSATLAEDERCRTFQKQLHDDLVDLETGNWIVDYDTQAKRKAHYEKVAKDFNLTIPQ